MVLFAFLEERNTRLKWMNFSMGVLLLKRDRWALP
jgi:hypothetical protein